MTQLWTFLAADNETKARQRALVLATDDQQNIDATTSDAIEFEPGRWRIKVALQRQPAD